MDELSALLLRNEMKTWGTAWWDDLRLLDFGWRGLLLDGTDK